MEGSEHMEPLEGCTFLSVLFCLVLHLSSVGLLSVRQYFIVFSLFYCEKIVSFIEIFY